MIHVAIIEVLHISITVKILVNTVKSSKQRILKVYLESLK